MTAAATPPPAWKALRDETPEQTRLRRRMDGREACAAPGVDPDWFFPRPARIHTDVARARAVCATCPVRAECLAYALADPNLDGVWGGSTVNQRIEIRRGNPALAAKVDTHCRNGHDLTAPGAVGSRGRCLECQRVQQARRRASKRRMGTKTPETAERSSVTA